MRSVLHAYSGGAVLDSHQLPNYIPANNRDFLNVAGRGGGVNGNFGHGISARKPGNIRPMKGNAAVFTMAAVLTAVQGFSQSYKPTAEETQRIQAKLNELDALFQPLLAKRGAGDPLVADVAVYQKSAQWALRYPEEFYKKEYVEKTLAALDMGIARAKSLAAIAGDVERPPSTGAGRIHVR